MIKKLIFLIKKLFRVRSPNKDGKWLFVVTCSCPKKCRCKQWIDPGVDELTGKKLRSAGQKDDVT